MQAASMQASPEARWDELVYSPSPQRTSPPPMPLQPQSSQSMRSNDASSSQSLNDFLEGTSLADQLPTWKPLPSVWNTAQVPTFDPLPPLRSPPQREELPRRERRASPLPASVSPPAALAPSPYASPAPVVPLHAREQEPLRPQSEIGLWLEDMLNLRENVAQVASGLRILGVRQPADLATINYRDLTSGLSGNLAQFLDEKQMEILVGAMAAQRHARARGGMHRPDTAADCRRCRRCIGRRDGRGGLQRCADGGVKSFYILDLPAVPVQVLNLVPSGT